jgi:uncharacterized protein
MPEAPERGKGGSRLVSASTVAITLDRIQRFPVKGLQGETLDAVAVAPAQGLPHDRRFAIARGDNRQAFGAPRWYPKEWFVMLMRDTALATLAPRVDWEAGIVELQMPGRPSCRAAFDTAAGREQLDAYVNDILGSRPEGRARWVESTDVSFTDVPQNCLSLLNLESVRDLEARMGCAIDPRRFRANLHVRGGAPWEELDWVGGAIRIGEVTLHVPARIPRCNATSVDPASGERDVNVVKGLRAAYGHYDMGVYAEVLRGGRVAVGDVVTPPDRPRRRSWVGRWLRFVAFLARGAPIVLRRR